MSADVRLTAWVAGRVQGVGYRWWVRRRALEFGLQGHAGNLDDGRVEIVVEGSREACQLLLDALGGPGSPGRTSAVVHRWGAARGDSLGFVEK
ncbi:MAG: acylphosphatase [Actinomycetota bacterium]|nr:acylphosphatase [Actinomycetota bacterium]